MWGGVRMGGPLHSEGGKIREAERTEERTRLSWSKSLPDKTAEEDDGRRLQIASHFEMGAASAMKPAKRGERRRVVMSDPSIHRSFGSGWWETLNESSPMTQKKMFCTEPN
jgi:hypothetical protein